MSLVFPLQIRYPNRPIVEFEIAAGEQMKITELRLAKLFSTKTKASSTGDQDSEAISKKAEGKLSSFSNSDFFASNLKKLFVSLIASVALVLLWPIAISCLSINLYSDLDLVSSL